MNWYWMPICVVSSVGLVPLLISSGFCCAAHCIEKPISAKDNAILKRDFFTFIVTPVIFVQFFLRFLRLVPAGPWLTHCAPEGLVGPNGKVERTDRTIPDFSLQQLDENECEVDMQKFKNALGVDVTRWSIDDVEQMIAAPKMDVVPLSASGASGVMAWAATGTVTLGRIALIGEATIGTKLDKAFVNFTLPVVQAETWTINGRSGDGNAFFFNADMDEGYINAPSRYGYFGRVPKDALRQELTALLGRNPEASAMQKGIVSVSSGLKTRLIRTFERLLSRASGRPLFPKPARAARIFEAEIVHALAVTVLDTRRTTAEMPVVAGGLPRLVGEAVALFDAAEPGSLTLKDICSALAVSAPTLNMAFQEVTGTTPMRFYRMKRLVAVRQDLLLQSGAVSAVKQAAMRQGFHDPSRMSALYRQVYNELPSETVVRRGRQAGL
ncbi:helix-turn-helix domain-containing protein [Ruegeria sp. WL0004]|uniref:Helix-turn-helix domain-containing protein n=1 Tax=Ruegeria marisflavi TaxID=2984152 RepID=A0ABT2WW13_9RHOB|nr:helix-turn-helix domain-containing protein [Ruegeria sp. WL0004]MCU9840089.1 helix-turn-helix domain-containing protein [Ruegeria sp. WL0004]